MIPLKAPALLCLVLDQRSGPGKMRYPRPVPDLGPVRLLAAKRSPYELLRASRNAVSGNLTVREIEVVWLAADGRTNGEIALALCITEHTVKSHLTKILGKLGFANRVQLATYAAELGLVQAAAPMLLG